MRCTYSPSSPLTVPFFSSFVFSPSSILHLLPLYLASFRSLRNVDTVFHPSLPPHESRHLRSLRVELLSSPFPPTSPPQRQEWPPTPPTTISPHTRPSGNGGKRPRRSRRSWRGLHWGHRLECPSSLRCVSVLSLSDLEEGEGTQLPSERSPALVRPVAVEVSSSSSR
jgi:hypothetical protein